jgi:hypothetical protein
MRPSVYILAHTEHSTNIIDEDEDDGDDSHLNRQ